MIQFNKKSDFTNIETDESDIELEKSVTSDVNDENQICLDKDKSNCNHTLEAAMDETSDIITEPRPPVVAVSTDWNTKSLQTEVAEPRDLNEVSNIKELYTYVNEIYKIMQLNKTDYKNISTLIFNLTNRVNKIEDQLSEFQASIAGRVLGTELEIEQIKNKKDKMVDNISRRVDQKTTKIGKISNFENVEKRLDEEIAQANTKIELNICELKRIAKEINSFSARDNTDSYGHQRNITPPTSDHSAPTDVYFDDYFADYTDDYFADYTQYNQPKLSFTLLTTMLFF